MSIVGFIFWMLVAVGIGMAIMGALVRFDDYDERKAKLLEKQYGELRAEGENYEPSVNAWAEMIARHKRERADLEK